MGTKLEFSKCLDTLQINTVLIIIKGLQCFMNPHDDKKKKEYQREKVTFINQNKSNIFPGFSKNWCKDYLLLNPFKQEMAVW